jgi:hypothetical protein
MTGDAMRLRQMCMSSLILMHRVRGIKSRRNHGARSKTYQNQCTNPKARKIHPAGILSWWSIVLLSPKWRRNYCHFTLHRFDACTLPNRIQWQFSNKSYNAVQWLLTSNQPYSAQLKAFVDASEKPVPAYCSSGR